MGMVNALKEMFAPRTLNYSAEELKIFASTRYISLVVSIFEVLGTIAVIIACWGTSDSLKLGVSALGTDLIVASGAGVCGGVLGFIFGIPRTESRNAVASAAVQGGKQIASSAALATNTNLERISD